MKLADIATINTGFLFRSRFVHQDAGEYQVIQVKDITVDNTLDDTSLERVDLKSVKDYHLVRKGDILFRSRGQQNLALVVENKLEKAIVVSQFFIIRVKGQKILPKYLAWYINQRPAQQYLVQAAAGTGTKHINMRNLEKLEIVVPQLEIQRKIVDIKALAMRENQIINQLQKKKDILLQALLLQKIS